MATATGIVNAYGLMIMVNAVQSKTLALKAYGKINNAGYNLLGTASNVVYVEAVSDANVIYINTNDTEIDIVENALVEAVQLWDTVNNKLVATVNISTENAFPDGGKLLVPQYDITVTSSL